MRKLIAALFVILLTVSFSSCRKEKDTTATVTILNASEQAVSGVVVRLYCPAGTCDRSQGQGELNEDMDRNDITGSNGKVSFNYTEMYKLGQAGFAVLDVAVYGSESDIENNVAPLTTGVIKIEEEKENEQTIICQSC